MLVSPAKLPGSVALRKARADEIIDLFRETLIEIIGKFRETLAEVNCGRSRPAIKFHHAQEEDMGGSKLSIFLQE
jgi:hypothetical protein